MEDVKEIFLASRIYSIGTLNSTQALSFGFISSADVTECLSIVTCTYFLGIVNSTVYETLSVSPLVCDEICKRVVTQRETHN